MRRCKGCVNRQLGPCQDYCYDERQGLIEWAQARSATLGHELGSFMQIPGYAVWVAHCIHCGRSAMVRLDPVEGKDAVDSEATQIPCPAPEGETPR